MPTEPCALYCNAFLRNATGVLVHAFESAIKLQDWVVDGTGCSSSMEEASSLDISLCINNKCMVSFKNLFYYVNLSFWRPNFDAFFFSSTRTLLDARVLEHTKLFFRTFQIFFFFFCLKTFYTPLS